MHVFKPYWKHKEIVAAELDWEVLYQPRIALEQYLPSVEVQGQHLEVIICSCSLMVWIDVNLREGDQPLSGGHSSGAELVLLKSLVHHEVKDASEVVYEIRVCWPAKAVQALQVLPKV